MEPQLAYAAAKHYYKIKLVYTLVLTTIEYGLKSDNELKLKLLLTGLQLGNLSSGNELMIVYRPFAWYLY